MAPSDPSAPRDRGAAAVELALVLPVLLLLLLGIIGFGRAWSWQIALTQAAREGVRVAALGMDSPTPAARVQEAARPDLPATQPIAVTVADACPAVPGPTTPPVTVTATTTYEWMPALDEMMGLVGAPPIGSVTLTGVGRMRCGG